MMRLPLLALVLAGCASTSPQGVAPAPHPGRTWSERLENASRSPEAWRARSEEIRRQILVSSGLWPEVDRGPVKAELSGRLERDGYSVEKLHLETLPGFKLTATLYRPLGRKGPFPAVANPHGHWKTGRFTDQADCSVPGRCINFARMGMVAVAYDMLGHGDLAPLGHKFGDIPWGLSLQGLQLWNSLKVVDFLCSLPEVDKTRIGVTGASGGGTQTFLLAAVDPRIVAAVPVNMVAAACQGGCLCENAPLLRLDLNNVEIAASIAPRAALLLMACTGDWTSDVPTVEGPALQKVFGRLGVPGKFRAVQIKADHNYNQETREYVYAFFQEQLLGGPKADRLPETPFKAEPRESMTLPAVGDLSALADFLRARAKAQWERLKTSPELYRPALAQVLGARVPEAKEVEAVKDGDSLRVRYAPLPDEILLKPLAGGPGPRIWVAATDAEAAKAPAGPGWLLRFGAHTREAACNEGATFQREGWKKWMDPYPATYYRTELARRVQDVLTALSAVPGAELAGEGEGAGAALLARCLAPGKASFVAAKLPEDQPGLQGIGGLEVAWRVAH